MPLDYHDLTDATRTHMVLELEDDLSSGALYVSQFLSEAGVAQYPALLLAALREGSDESLTTALAEPGVLEQSYTKRKPKGGLTTAKVPYTAPSTLAEGEFNRYYLRGLCRRALDDRPGQIEVYRARPSVSPRPESEALIGARLDAAALLADLRANTGVDTALGLPPGPNSGLSGRIVRWSNAPPAADGVA